jgi:NADH-quinone oxidoreductase subunit E
MLAVKTGQEVHLKPETYQKIQEVMELYPEGKSKSAILPVLHIVQDENSGWLSVEAMDLVAKLMKLQPIEVYEVATFYSMYNLKPVGKYLLEVCHTGPCAIMKGEWLVDYLKKKLNIKVGETTADGMFTLKTVECLGACGYSPMMQVGEYYYEFLDTEEKVDTLLNDFMNKAAQNN